MNNTNPSKEPKVAREVAEAEFERFLEAMGLVGKTDAKELDPDDLKSFNEAKRTIIESMMSGNLMADAEGQLVFTPQIGDTSPIVFYEPDGAALMAMDQAKQGRFVEKGHRLLAAVTRQQANRFAQMKQRDHRVCDAIIGLFLG